MGDVTLRVLRTEDAPAPVAGAPYSQAIEASGRTRTIYVSGQVPVDVPTGLVVDGGVAAQTRQALANLEAILAAGGASLQDVVKTTVFMTNLADFTTMNTEYAAAFGHHAPARSTVQVAALPLGAEIEIEAIAVLNDEDDY